MTTLQHLTAAEYCTCTFSADCTPIVRYLLAVVVICYIASVENMLHMQCCKVAKMQPLKAVELISGWMQHLINV